VPFLVAGTRLRLEGQSLRGDDGSLIAPSASFFDTKRGERCYPIEDVDGVTRCFPTATASIGAFADDDCTRRVASADGCAPVPAYGVVVHEGSCGARGGNEYFAIGAELSEGQPVFYKGAVGSSCYATGRIPGRRYFEARPIASSEFVAFRPE
jgi:hypothetical protein